MEAHPNSPGAGCRTSIWLVFAGAVLIPCLYLPTLATRFDFIDDGNLVYPTGPMSWGERLRHVADRVEDNYRHLGPFRPFLHAYWEAQAELLQGDAVRWRVWRLAWSMLAAAALLGLLRELGIRPVAAVLTTALAMGNPYRNEIWTSLTLSEGVAMPFALFALVCAARAARARHPWAWDLAGALSLLAALGCKNTFAAVVPAQVLLRALAAGAGWREGLRRHGGRAWLLALPLLLPVGHYLYFKLHWQPGQYTVPGASWAGLGQYLRSLGGGLSLDFMGLGLGLSLLAVWAHRRSAACGERRGVSPPVQPVTGGLTPRRSPHAPIAVGLLLLACGVAVYLPMGVVSGRYTMPAVWGADLLVAVSLHELSLVPAPRWRRGAFAAVGCGLVVVMVANVGKQVKFAARAAFLWQMLEHVERHAPLGACVGWQSGSELNVEEGIHFAWHLRGRGRSDLEVKLLIEDGGDWGRCELGPCTREPDLLLSAAGTPPRGRWREVRHWSERVPGRRLTYTCRLWVHADQLYSARLIGHKPGGGRSNRAGARSWRMTALAKAAPTAPSTTRWSNENER